MPTKFLHVTNRKSPRGEGIYVTFHSSSIDNHAKICMEVTKTSHINLRLSELGL